MIGRIVGIKTETAYHQTALINKINQYFDAMKRPLWGSDGYCHGLAVLWQQKMTDKREQQFYAVIKKIIHQPADKLAELDDDIEVQKFIAQVEYAQNPGLYGGRRQIRQIDVDVIMGASREIYCDKWFSIRSFAKLLDDHAKSRPSITVVCTASCHSIGIYFRDNKYYLFDANYATGEAKQYDSSIAAAYEMMNCLYRKFGLKPPHWTQDLRAIMLNPKPSKFNERKPSISHSAVTLFPPIKLVHQLNIKTEETSQLKLK